MRFGKIARLVSDLQRELGGGWRRVCIVASAASRGLALGLIARVEDVSKVFSGIISLILYLALIPVITNMLQTMLSTMGSTDPTMSALISAIVGLLPTIMVFKALERIFDAF